MPVVPCPLLAHRLTVASLHPARADFHHASEPDPERLAGWAAKGFLPLEEARPPETCLCTNTPDREFVLDGLGPIVVGSPCSGHGFKFAPLIGKILADMATGRPIGLRLDAFRAGREWTRRHMVDRASDA